MCSPRMPAVTYAWSRSDAVSWALTPELLPQPTTQCGPSFSGRAPVDPPWSSPDSLGTRGISAAVRSRSTECSAASDRVAPAREASPIYVTPLARMVSRVADPPASRSAVSAADGIGASSLDTLASRYPSTPPVNVYVQRSAGLTVSVVPAAYMRSCCGLESAANCPGFNRSNRGFGGTPAFLA